jgi:hypothetical protein
VVTLPNQAMFDCRRCGVPVYEYGGICRDCLAFLSEHKEKGRWTSDYSREQRRRMTSVIKVPPSPWPEHGVLRVVDYPRRDQPLPKQPPLDLSRYDTEEAS